MQEYIYCRSWAGAFKEARNPMNEEEAKKIHETLYGISNQNVQGGFKEYTKRHRGGILQYTVLLGSLEKPTAFAQFVSNGIWVNFLDDKLRAYLEYSFNIIGNNKLFLDKAVYREFDGDSDKVSKGTLYLFEEDGRLIIDRETFLPEHLLEKATNTIDVSDNYEPFPVFGNFENILRQER
ncbi:hypothetical protein [Sulfurospirillum sp. hDNRA2]|jgi:hypothetical protein|uniref:hypothetical protein n=1 Tax=Sulfurospirillum sp. hDNRA2 TaxID=3237298 RepID=UPI0020B8F82D|nr:hypothetical protein [Sulfurospirillum sp. DNRA8]MCP3650818.1 hypothetical protein [Sulfurospirillum sp. DNRA8]MCR1809663.1 hypothetical protein [Sulfurospirillum sp. DNRA8]